MQQFKPLNKSKLYIRKDILDLPVEMLDVPSKVYNVLKSRKLNTVGDVLTHGIERTSQFRDTDLKTVKVVSDAIESIINANNKTFHYRVPPSEVSETIRIGKEQNNFDESKETNIEAESTAFKSLDNPVTDDVNKDIFKTSLDEFVFSTRVYETIKKLNLNTIGDVLNFGLNRLRKTRNFGKKSLKELEQTIKDFLQIDKIEDAFIEKEEKKNAFNEFSSKITSEETLDEHLNKTLLETSLDDFFFSARVNNALAKANLETVGDLLDFGWDNILKEQNVGRKSLNELKNAIENFMKTGHIIEKSKKEITHLEKEQKTLFDSEDDKTYFTEVMENILSSFLTEKQLQIIKARYGYEDGKKKTLEQIGNEVGITRERVRQIIVNSLRNLQHPARIKFLQVILENIESVLLYNKGVINVNDLFTNDFFSTGTKKQLNFLLNLIADLYEERYRKIGRNFLTSLSAEELNDLHSTINEAALRCQFPINKADFFQGIISTIGHTSKDYLSFYLINKKHAEILSGSFLTPGKLSILQRIKLIMKNINSPMHYTEIASQYNKYFRGESVSTANNAHAIHSHIGKSDDFIIVGRGTFILRDKFKLPDNIDEIVETSREILLKLNNTTDTKYLIQELQRRGRNVGNLNEYSLKPILLDNPEFVHYRKFEIGIKKTSTGYERKSLSDLMYDVLIKADKQLHSKEIWKQINKQRGFPKYAIEQRLYKEPRFIKVALSTYTVKEHIASYEQKRKLIIHFTKEWINLKGHAVSAFFVNEVIKATEDIKDLTIGLVEHVLATSSEFVKLPNRFYELANK